MRKSDVRGPACPVTGRTVADELQHAVAMLASSKVSERDGVRYNDAELRAYCDGYYRALSASIAVMQHALERRRLRLGFVGEGETWDKRQHPHSRARSARTGSNRSSARATPSVAPPATARATRRRSPAARAS